MASITADLSERNPSLFQFLAWKIAKTIDRSGAKERRARTVVQASIRILLHIVGFSCLTIAGFHWSTIAGFVVTAISCFAMSALLTTSSTPDTSNR